ncbi:MAG: glucoamylase family protein [bacterium]|nr:glucoamylase family protein [bacterium]
MNEEMTPEKLGERCGSSIKESGRLPGRRMEREVRRAWATLERRHDAMEQHSAPEGADRWLWDNYYFLQRCVLSTGKSFRRAALRGDGKKWLLLTLTEELVSESGGALTEDYCRAFLRGFRKKIVLSEAELRLFPAAVRASLLFALSSLYRGGSAREQSVAALLRSLRLVDTGALSTVAEEESLTESILRQDPAGVYGGMDRESRAEYRRQVEKLAKKRGIPEFRYAEMVLRQCRESTEEPQKHVGWQLFHDERCPSGGGYIAANVLLTLFFTLLGGFLLRSVAAAPLLLLPVSEIVKQLTDLLLGRLTPPRRLLRMELRRGVPEEGRTICVLSVLLNDGDEAEKAAERLEEFRLANRDCGDNLLFGLLCDLPGSVEEEREGDRALLCRAAAVLEEVNRRWGGGFYLLTRKRRYNRMDDRYEGWERKRGALMSLAALLCGEKSELICPVGDTDALRKCRFILTLDADSRPTPGSIRPLIGAMLHPLNRCVVDAQRKLVLSGHGVIQPRIAVELQSSTRSDLARLFSGQGGICTYGGCTGNLYMDRYGSGGFAGKGLLDARALWEVMGGRIGEGQVLSHDALEGAFLHGALMEDVEITDSFPSSPLAWQRRQHRWVRGDWQNLPWLFARGRALPPMERWRLFDSLRRSLLPFASLCALLSGMFFPTPALRAVSLFALLSLLSPLLFALLRTALQREEDARIRVLSEVFHGLALELTATLGRLLLLPWEAWVSFSAAVTALWRMGVTRRGLLEWQTAAQSEQQSRGGLEAAYGAMKSAVAVGLLCLFAPTVPGKAAGVAYLLSPLFVASLGRSRESVESLSREQRSYLLLRAGEIWKYFDTFCTAEDHFLPPDNYQETPGVGVAHRTSPTNIGLGMVACLSAVDLGLCPRQRALGLLERMVEAVEAMPKWHGHLYNWVNTRTLQPLQPGYVSTVDSGNLAGCLLSVCRGLEEYGCQSLSERVYAIYTAMDFRPLYDEKRHLFRIGLSPEGARGEVNHYDLLESEERLTGYIAVASGQAPLRHWQQLSRAQVSCDGYRGCVSWSGSMFEYLMPELFLPLHKNSLLYESARFCLYVQRRQRFGRFGVWGKSESAFFSLDGSLNYHYKAHGCQRLALCRGMDREKVVAPYASFLALMLEPRAAIRNLRAFEKLGALGPYGFWEAVDFTPGRTGREERIVRCVMAHHLGMSMAAVANTLCANVCRRRFLAERAMSAYEGLLEEKIPLGGAVLRHRSREFPAPAQRGNGFYEMKNEGVRFLSPQCALLSNGVYSIMSTESGITRAQCGALRPYRSPRELPGEDHGVELWLRVGERWLSLLPGDDSGSAFRWRFTAESCVWEGSNGPLRWRVTLTVPADECGERREVTVRGVRRGEKAELYASFEPQLCSDGDYYGQIAYRRLGVETRGEDGCCLISRLAPQGGRGMHLAFAASEKAEFSGDFFRFPGRGGGRPFVPNQGWQSAPRCTARLPLRGGGVQTVTLAVAMGSSAASAREAAAHILASHSASAMAETAARLLGMDSSDALRTLRLLPSLLFPHVNPFAGAEGEDTRRDALWRLGLSGDLPIAALEPGTEKEAVAQHIRAHALLSACGVSYDLVLLCSDLGEYRHSRSAETRELLRKLGREQRIGEKGGIHLLDAAHAPALQAAAALYESGAGGEGVKIYPSENIVMLTSPAVPRSAQPPRCQWTEEGVELTIRGTLPPRSWSHLLCNERFGCLTGESGLGFLWYKNARECPLTPWGGDVLAVEGSERLEFAVNGVWHSVFARSGEESRVCFGFGFARWEKEIGGVRVTVTVWVPREGTERVMEIRCSRDTTFRWCLPLQMGSEWGDGRYCRVSGEEEGFRAENVRCSYPGVVLHAQCSVPFSRRATDRLLWLGGGEGQPVRSGDPCFAGEFTVQQSALLRLGVGELPEETPPLEEVRRAWRETVTALTGHTGEEMLDHLLGGWCQYQALCGRIYGRTSLYQSGGAWGFRDQLQDYVNLLPLTRDACRAHILRCCAHQYEEGDVQHWWHEGVAAADKGVRTRCSDDLLWLVWAVCEYVEKSGDTGILQESVPYLYSSPLEEGEDSRYETPRVSSLYESVEEHCLRALDLVMRRGTGRHGLLLMGSGDWNDGLSAMGEGSESVWLSFFFAGCVRSFTALLSRERGRDGERYLRFAREVARAADGTWNGSYWPRGYYGDGEELGVLDAVVQSCGALCPDADSEHGRVALRTALDKLYDGDRRIFSLSDRPYGPRDRSPGYITLYGPGFRENGGQYTHAALFFAHALFRRGMASEGLAILRCACGEGREEDFALEPYVIPADIYTNPNCPGRGGWSWYTGSAGWFFRVAMEDLLGWEMKNGAEGEMRCAMVPGWEDFRLFRRDGVGGVRTILPYSKENS